MQRIKAVTSWPFFLPLFVFGIFHMTAASTQENKFPVVLSTTKTIQSMINPFGRNNEFVTGTEKGLPTWIDTSEQEIKQEGILERQDPQTRKAIRDLLEKAGNPENMKPYYIFSQDEKRMLFQDGNMSVKLFDLKKRAVTSELTIPKAGETHLDSKVNVAEIAYFLFTPENDVIIEMQLPRFYTEKNLSSYGRFSEPALLTYCWNPASGKVTFPEPWTIKGAYTLKHWLSPDRRYLAVIRVPYDAEKFSISEDGTTKEHLCFFDLTTNEMVGEIVGNLLSVRFSEDWKTVDVVSWEDKQKDSYLGITTCYDLSVLEETK